MKRSLALAILLSFVGLNAFAIKSEEAFELLKNSKENYEPIGAICEQVARLELAQEYDQNKYEIIVGIEYADSRQTIGELDVVIFEKATKKAILSAEVKCWNSIEGAKKKATEQRRRFIRYNTSGYKLFFESKDMKFEQYQFQDIREFIMIAQKGSKKKGFDRELEMSLDDLMALRRRILSCQTYRNCG
ncbi:hypothetical protein D3C87_189910 [compost metagenome]